MKGMDMLCASQASTAICLNLNNSDIPSSSSSTSLSNLLGSSSPAIDRYNPIITDTRRVPKTLPVFVPKPPKRKGDTKKENDQDQDKNGPVLSAARKSVGGGGRRKSWSCTRPGDFFSPPGSTRYLLGDKGLSIKGLSDEFDDPSHNLAPVEMVLDEKEVEEVKQDQVVVLRVSLHCRGCEKKMRKHISRMKGVTSLNIDFAAKKVTVSGKITPVEVLTSISKVKNAQLWSPTMPTTVNFNNNGSYKTY